MTMPTRIDFATLFATASLNRTWRQLRKELKRLAVRDVVDWLDWVTTIDRGISELRDELLNGVYRPLPPSRTESPKSGGAFRLLTSPNIRDALVYRHISDVVLERATPEKVPGAFYSRRHARTPVGNTFAITDDPSPTFFHIWLRYNQYRTLTLLNQPYRILVVSDITNYFDSIPHDLLLELVSQYGLPREALGTLRKLLEAFRPPAGHSSSPAIGLAVDDMDCSRQLATVFLFPHDHRIVKRFGRNNYARWMDDQNIGVNSLTEARHAVNHLTRSLSEQRLTLNSGKTRALSPVQVSEHFQLPANKTLDEWEEAFKRQNRRVTPSIAAQFTTAWNTIIASPDFEKGNWDKVLKRGYACATTLRLRIYEHQAYTDLVRYPYLAERIFQYFARRNRGLQLVNLFLRYCRARENIHEHVEAAFFEATLLLDPSPLVASQLRQLASLFAASQYRFQTKRPLGIAGAVLLLYWLGVGGRRLASLFPAHLGAQLAKEPARAWVACLAATHPKLLADVLQALLGNPSDDVARLARFLASLIRGHVDSIGNYQFGRRSRWPLPGSYYDARSWLVLELCSHSSHRSLRASVRVQVARFAALARTRPEQRILARIRRRL